jgi:hypothetical protein
MSESTLALRKVDIEARLGTYAGWGRGEYFGDEPWTDEQKASIKNCVDSGCRRVYYPAPLEGEPNSHSWSFFRPVTLIALPSGSQSVILPDDYGSFEGNITILTSANGVTAQPWKIQWENEGRIREMYTVTSTISGPPMYVCPIPVKDKMPTATQGQRFELLVFPTADQDYTLQATYNINPGCLTDAFPYTLGGPQHSETFLESALAYMELFLDDRKGIHCLEFDKRLAASIDIDRRARPQRIGYNGDRSDDRDYQRPNMHWYAPAATYNGQSLG